MSQYNTLNIKLSNSQLNKLKLGMKNGTKVTLKLSSKAIGDCIDETIFFINCNQIIKYFQRFVKLLQMVHQLI